MGQLRWGSADGAAPMGQRRWGSADGAAPMGQRRWGSSDGAAPMGQRRWGSADGAAPMGQHPDACALPPFPALSARFPQCPPLPPPSPFGPPATASAPDRPCALLSLNNSSPALHPASPHLRTSATVALPLARSVVVLAATVALPSARSVVVLAATVALPRMQTGPLNKPEHNLISANRAACCNVVLDPTSPHLPAACPPPPTWPRLLLRPLAARRAVRRGHQATRQEHPHNGVQRGA
eukprot:360762-Chlamydomonas_euryale.AAC.18